MGAKTLFFSSRKLNFECRSPPSSYAQAMVWDMVSLDRSLWPIRQQTNKARSLHENEQRQTPKKKKDWISPPLLRRKETRTTSESVLAERGTGRMGKMIEFENRKKKILRRTDPESLPPFQRLFNQPIPPFPSPVLALQPINIQWGYTHHPFLIYFNNSPITPDSPLLFFRIHRVQAFPFLLQLSSSPSCPSWMQRSGSIFQSFHFRSTSCEGASLLGIVISIRWGEAADHRLEQQDLLWHYQWLQAALSFHVCWCSHHFTLSLC